MSDKHLNELIHDAEKKLANEANELVEELKEAETTFTQHPPSMDCVNEKMQD